MAYFKLEFGFGRSKSEGKISDTANLVDEQVALEIPGWDFVNDEVERAKQQGRFKVAGNYLTAARSFTKFIGTDNWLFSDMTAEKLESYQRWLLGRNICLNTCSAYMRALRAMHHRALPVLNAAPFSKVFTGRTKTEKRCISQSEILQLKALPLQPGGSLSFARDIFLFSFYAMGMPFVDIAYLKKSQLRNGCIYYARHKTGQQIQVAHCLRCLKSSCDMNKEIQNLSFRYFLTRWKILFPHHLFLPDCIVNIQLDCASTTTICIRCLRCWGWLNPYLLTWFVILGQA